MWDIFRPSKWKNAWDDYNLFTGNKWWGKSTEDINDEYQSNVNKALSDAEQRMNVNRDILTGAMTRDDGTKRTLGTALDTYDKANQEIAQGLKEQLNAGDQERVRGYLNPMVDYINENVTQNVQGSAGAALQSSGTQNAIAKGVADASASQWNNAFQQSMADSSNNQNVYGGMMGQAERVLTADAMPQQDLMSMNNDWNTAVLQAQTAMAGQQAATDSADEGIFGRTGRLMGAFAPMAMGV